MSQDKLTQRQARWVTYIQGFNMTIIHKLGRFNIVADALSRRPDYAMDINSIFVDQEININTLTTQIDIPALREEIAIGYATDTDLGPIFTAVQDQTDPVLCRKYRIVNGLLYLQDMDCLRLCIPDTVFRSFM